MRDAPLISGSRDDEPDAPRRAAGGHDAAPRPASGRPLPWIAGVAAAFTLVQLLLVSPGVGLGWDETVYVSQVSPQAPAAYFSAPRARGISYLVAPVTELTTSTAVLRGYLSLLAGGGLFLALWVWRRLLPAPVLAVAGALFTSLWVTLFYGAQVMPNLWVAYGALLATGCFLRAVRDGTDRWARAGLACGVALAALMRPTDAVWLVLPLAAAALVLRARRRTPVLPVLGLLGAGLVLGCAPWVIEAYTRYGGLFTRLARASEIQGDLGWHVAVDDHVRALVGRTLCRPCEGPWDHPVTGLWFLLLPLLVAGGVWAARRGAHRAPITVAAVTGLVAAVPYLFTVGYAAPRFLLPAYALLALPVAYGLVRACRMVRGRRLLIALVAVAVAGHLAVQYRVLAGVVHRVRADTADHGRVAAALHAQGVRPPCLISGEEAIRVAFRVGCASRQVTGHDTSITPAGVAAEALRQPVAVLLTGGQRPMPAVRGWRLVRLPDLGRLTDYRAYVSPSAVP